MLRYTIGFTTKAEKQFRKLDQGVQKKLSKEIDRLSENPRPIGVKKLSGEEDLYRVRVGDYRILYAIEDRKLVVLVVKVGHRRDVYQ